MSLPTLTTQIAFFTDPDATPAYIDVSSYVMEVSIRRGRQHELDVAQPGVCEIKMNNGDRRFDPAYTLSPYYPNVLPMRKIQVTATWNAVVYYLFTGYVERWPISWEAPKWGSVTLTAVDGMTALAQADIAGDFPLELTGSRISRVLAAADWPTSTPVAGGYWVLGTSALGTTTVLSYSTPSTVIDVGQSYVPAVTITAGSGVSALSHIQDVVQAERGMFFIDGQGRSVFQDRRDRYGTTSTVTFTDDLATLSSSRLQYQELQPDFAIDRVANEVIVTRTGGTAQTASDAASRRKYRRRTLALSVDLTSDAEAYQRAGFEVALRKEPKLEFTALTVKPTGQDFAWPHALGRELSDRISVQRTPGSTPAVTAETINRDVFLESTQHRVAPGRWDTTYQLSSASQYDSFWVLGTSALGTATLAY